MALVNCALCRKRLLTPILRETGLWRVALNRNQNLLGKTIVVLRRHEEDVALLTADEWDALHEHVRWMTDRLRAAYAPEHVNYAFLQNQDRHVHLHVIPRYAGIRSVAGLEFDDPDYPGHYRAPRAQRVVEAEVLAAVAADLTG